MTDETKNEQALDTTEEKPIPPPDHDYSHPPKVGELWFIQDLLWAFILEVNEYAVIYQNRMGNTEENEGFFDFKAGQERLSIKRFLFQAEQRKAVPKKGDEDDVQKQLAKYEVVKRSKLIVEPKPLPMTASEGQVLEDYEHYTIDLRIVPPPPNLRDIRGYHWLGAGTSGTHFVCKLWDPKQDNYVFHNGEIDVTAGRGFVTHYAAAGPIFMETGGITFDQLKTRVVVAMRNGGYMFDEEDIRENLEAHNPFKSPGEGVEKVFPVAIEEGQTPSLVPALEVKFLKKELGENTYALMVLFFDGTDFICGLLYDQLVNGAFLPKQTPDFFDDMIVYLHKHEALSDSE